MSSPKALDVLEFDSILERLATHAETEIGAAACAALRPSWTGKEVWTLLDQTIEALEVLGKAPPKSMSGVFDCVEPVKRAEKGGVLAGRDLFQIGSSLAVVREQKAHFEPLAPTHLGEFVDQLEPIAQLDGELLHSLESDGEVKDDASPLLREIRSKLKGGQARIIETIQRFTTGKSKEYLSDPIYTVREGRYVVPVRSEHRGKIRGIVHDSSATGQTIYVEPEEVLALANHLRELTGKEAEEVKRILTRLSARVGQHSKSIIQSVRAISAIDAIFARARLAAVMRACIPERGSATGISIQNGRHPLLSSSSVVPTTVAVSPHQSVLITGPNTGGKTVAIKLVGLCVLMLQSGLLAPATHVVFQPFSQIWADIGDEQSIHQSLSTFSGHLKNIGLALSKLQPGALVLLDEVGAGTDPTEGAALARAILQTMDERGAAILASTHYGELKAFAFTHPHFVNASMEFDNKSLQPTYRLIMGAAGASQALKIAERYGISQEIIERAKSELSQQQVDVAKMLASLENSQRLARQAQSEADRKLAELKKLNEQAEQKLRQAEEARKRANERAETAIQETLRELRLEAEIVIDELKKRGGGSEQIQRAREHLKSVDARGQSLGKKFKNPSAPPTPNREPISKGDSVTILGFQQTGVVIAEPSGGTVEVQVGAIKMKVMIAKLTKVQPKATPSKNANPGMLARAMNARTELSLRNMRAEDARQELEKFIDDALLADVPYVRLIHGKGEGILRQITQDFLRAHSGVKHFRDGDPSEGGQGVTIATFK